MTDLKDFHENLERMNAAQSKVNMQNNVDKFAMDFGLWLLYWSVADSKIIDKDIKELLQIFKEQRR
jgi:hypothetical protein